MRLKECQSLFFVMNSDGAGARQLTTSAGASLPVKAPAIYNSAQTRETPRRNLTQPAKINVLEVVSAIESAANWRRLGMGAGLRN